ncbi:MAG: T9SS type A sorting domain-containing protein [Flavobacteriales bacterium]|nr:T9SS type A sorting domain-containing protein [Flavobacteriales bacterium]
MRKHIYSALLSAVLFFTIQLSQAQQDLQTSSDRTWQEMMLDPSSNFFEIQSKFNTYWENRPVTRSSGFRAFKRWEWFMTPRVDANGTLPAPDAVWQAVQNDPVMFETNTNMPGDWYYIGNTSVPSSGGGAGRINSVRVLPGSTTTFFACSPGGGLWKSTDSGSSWSMLGTDFLASIGVSDVAIDPTNTNIMYLATGDCDAGDTYALGVLKSTDGGNTWNTTGLNWTVTQSRSTARILIDPNNTQIVLCVTSNGIYRTTDGGTNWAQVQSGSFKDLRMKPGDSNTWYASSDQFYKSTNGGVTWTLITAGLPAVADAQRMSIAVSAADPTVVYALASGNDSGLLGVWKSTDSGTTFTQMADNNPNYLNWDTSATANTGGQGWYDLRIEAKETDANVIYIGGVNVWRSSNGGSTFSLVGHWYGGGGAPYVHADIHAIYQVPGTSRILVGCDGGVFTTTNEGVNFSDISTNLPIAQQYRMSVAATNSNIVISGWQDNGTNLKNGSTHSRPLGGDGMDCQIDPSNANIMYGELYYGSINKSTNGGASWSNIVGSGGTNEDEDGAWVTPYILGPNPSHIFVGKSVVYKSTNGGTTFTASAAFGGTSDCNDLAIAPSNANILYASKGSSLFKSTDNAATFNAVVGLPSSYITDIAIHNTDPNKVWVTFSNYTTGMKIYYTSDGGSNWTNISGTLPNIPANAVAYAPGSNNGIYVGMDAGVFYRDDILGAFVPYMNALPHVSITDLDIHTGTSTITASSFGRGLWRAPLYALPDLDAALLSISEPNGTYCSTSVTPTIAVLNTGTSPIISMTIEYQVTGQALQTYNWVGNIATGITETITLPALDYGAGSFSFNVNITSVNTIVDDNTANNSAASSYYCISGTNTATLVLETDCWANETSWNITDSNGNVMFSGSGYSNETTNNITLCLPDDCFSFNIFDSYGDGLSNTGCALGNGNYYIYDNATTNNIVLMGAANFGTGTSHAFCYPLTTVPGCMDSGACNYNALATFDDGTCTYGPANDICVNASTITVDAAAISANNQNACVNTTNPTCGGATQIKDLWYKFVYNGGRINISTNFTGGTLTDTRLALYSSCGGTQIACNDDIGGGNYKSLITVGCGVLTFGQTYYIQAGGYQATTGTFSLQVYTTAETCNGIDDDCDSVIDDGFDVDGDTYTTCNGDCNDNVASIHPGAAETCNLTDDDCDGLTDEGVQSTFYLDADNDGYGNLALTTQACTAPTGYVANSTDCNDAVGSIHPGATETCNSIDDDCDSQTDEGVQTTFYRDADNDGYGNAAITAVACTAPSGYVANSTDCNDALGTVNPGSAETCNSVDDDCDSNIDEGVLLTYYEDSDNDGYGNIAVTTLACSAPSGFVSNNTDCNDNDNNVFPGAPEACNSIDDNCDTAIDNGVTSQNYYVDADNDGYGSTLIGNFCSAPANSSLNNLDCNDSNSAVNPNEVETCNNIDDNCNTTIDEGFDADGDGYKTCQGDCHDGNDAINPGATETCNSLDDDCDGLTDEGLTVYNWYVDSDGDTYGSSAATPIQSCQQPVGYVLDHTDCNDGISSIHPLAPEICSNSIDDDCDGQTDEGCIATVVSNDNVSNAAFITSTGNIYPYCNPLSGTCLGATPSPEASPLSVITGEDVWYRFMAISPGVRISFSSTNFNGVVELYNGSLVLLNSENLTGNGGNEYLNFTGLTESQQYYIAVRNYDSSAGNGTFTICAQALMDSNCDYGSGTYPICNNFKADWTAANFYTFNFTPVGGGVTTSVTSTGYVQLGNMNLSLLPSQSYINTIDAVYYLQNGLGQMEQLVVMGNENCLVTIAPQSDVQVKSTQRCPNNITRSTYLRGTPNVCGATNYEFEFTPIDALGTPLGGSFTRENSTANPFLLLSFTNPQQLQLNAYYSVRIRPIFPSGPGTFGTAQCIHIVPVTSGGVIDHETVVTEAEWNEDGPLVTVYPNPSTGQEIMLEAGHDNTHELEYAIYDSQGRIIAEQKRPVYGRTRESIRFVTPLAPGIYAMHIYLDHVLYIEKIVIQH